MIRARIQRLATTLAAVAVAGVGLTACATTRPTAEVASAADASKAGKPYQVRGKWYTPSDQPGYDEVGAASWYGEKFHNKNTANGEPFDMARISAAHTTLPLPSLVEVTNLENGRSITVRVNDRGPFVEGRIIDLSRAGAEQLGYARKGVTQVRVRYIGPAPAVIEPPGASVSYAAAEGAPPAVKSPSHGFRVQAAAFADRGRADAAVQTLSSAGTVEVSVVQKGAATLYRVQVTGEGEADEARARVVALGYTDARVIQGY